MTVTTTQAGYRVDVTDAERNQLIIAAELALAIRRGDRDAARLVLDLDADALDAICDRLALAGAAG